MGHGVLSIATEKGHIQVVLKNSQPSDGERPAQMERSWAQMERGWAQMERDTVHKWRGAGTNRERLYTNGEELAQTERGWHKWT